MHWGGSSSWKWKITVGSDHIYLIDNGSDDARKSKQKQRAIWHLKKSTLNQIEMNRFVDGGEEKVGRWRSEDRIGTGEKKVLWVGRGQRERKGLHSAPSDRSNRRYFSNNGRSSWYVCAYMVNSGERLVGGKSPRCTFRSFVSATGAVQQPGVLSVFTQSIRASLSNNSCLTRSFTT